jgi:hypothetical protein
MPNINTASFSFPGLARLSPRTQTRYNIIQKEKKALYILYEKKHQKEMETKN